MDVIDDVAERRFSWLLRQRGCTFVRENELEKAITVLGSRPDFYASSPAGPFLAEVKSFRAAWPDRSPRSMPPGAGCRERSLGRGKVAIGPELATGFENLAADRLHEFLDSD